MSHRRHLLLALTMTILCSALSDAAAVRRQRSSTLAAAEMRKQIGVFLRSTGITEPADALKAVKSLGIDLVQISRLPDRFYTPAGARELERLLKDTGLRAVSVVVVFDGESYRDIDAIEATVGFRPAHLVAARLAYARTCVDFAAALGVRIVTFHVGVLPKDAADPAYRRMLNAVTDIARYAAGRKVTISLETGQETAEELARFLDAVAVPGVGVNFDIANLVLYGTDDPPAALRRLLNRVNSMHMKDGILPAAPRVLGKETRLGEGRGDVKTCLGILLDAGFDGPLVIENYVARETGAQPMDELRRAKAFIDKTLDELGQERVRAGGK